MVDEVDEATVRAIRENRSWTYSDDRRARAKRVWRAADIKEPKLSDEETLALGLRLEALASLSHADWMHLNRGHRTDNQKRLKTIARLSKELQSALSSDRPDLALSMLERGSLDHDFPVPDLLAAELLTLSDYCEAILASIGRTGLQHLKGETTSNRDVIRLACAYEKWSKRTAAVSKTRDRRYASPFVRFVQAAMNEFEFNNHEIELSPDAIAHALSVRKKGESGVIKASILKRIDALKAE
jgi:hypothetical protein